MNGSVEVHPSNDCVICNVQEQDILISNTFVIVSASPLGIRPGHMVVAPKRHVESFGEMSPYELTNFTSILSKTLIAAECSISVERYYVLRLSDKVRHLHFHLIPRLYGDKELGDFVFGEQGWAKAITAIQNQAEMELFASKFKRHFRS
jgi:diadenosine tetraphosphate (Ap4A) HIT family hydrolase